MPRLSRPLYEGLPWVYIIFGLGALIASYLRAHGFVSLTVGVVGLLCVVGGSVVLLRRRDYRALRSQYADPDSLGGSDKL
jgi:Flp pilus assembly protein TadB